MIEKITLFTLGTAALGLLFYWLKRRKTRSKTKQEGDMAFGVQVADQSGKLIDLTARPVMVLDLISIAENQGGSKSYHLPISSVVADCDYTADPTYEGKYLAFSYSGNQVSWRWGTMRGIRITSAKLIILTGGING